MSSKQTVIAAIDNDAPLSAYSGIVLRKNLVLLAWTGETGIETHLSPQQARELATMLRDCADEYEGKACHN